MKTDLNLDIKNKAIDYLLKNLGKVFWIGLDEAVQECPDRWWAISGWHFHQGMTIRNMLRNIISDKELPSGNWDDYYIEVIESALKKSNLS